MQKQENKYILNTELRCFNERVKKHFLIPSDNVQGKITLPSGTVQGFITFPPAFDRYSLSTQNHLVASELSWPCISSSLQGADVELRSEAEQRDEAPGGLHAAWRGRVK